MNENDKKEVDQNKYIQSDKVSNNIMILTVIVSIFLVILLLVNFTMDNFQSKSDVTTDIKKVKKILNEKYNDIECVDSKCNYIVATTGNPLKKITYNIFNTNGKKVGQYIINYEKKNIKNTKIIGATNKFIVTSMNNSKNKYYAVYSNKGKLIYSTENEVSIVSKNLFSVILKEGKYDILNSNGKVIYNKIDDYEVYGDNRYISIRKNNKYFILGQNGKKILNNYKISLEVNDQNSNLLYLIVRNIENDTYNYFDIKNNKKIGDSFLSYSDSLKFGELIIDKKINNQNVKYILNKKGKQLKASEKNVDQNANLSKIKSKIDTNKYYLYSYGIENSNQNYVLVNNNEEKSFGILNIKTDDYEKLIDYNKDKSSSFVSIIELNNKNDKILRINCSNENCKKEISIIYNLSKNSKIYSEEKNAIVSDYASYKNNYKVVKYSYSSSNEELRGKYVLYDKDNKQILKSNSFIVVVDSELEIGKIPSNYILLYSSNDKKFLNSEKTKADKIQLSNKVLYRYISNNKTIICNSEGKRVVEIDSSNYITYSNSNIIYINDDHIYIYDASKDRTRNYKLRDNEKLNGESNDIVSPYRGAVFINNSSDKIVKVINSKGNVIRKIKNSELVEVKKNKSTGEALIIVKKSSKNKDIYGMYLAK